MRNLSSSGAARAAGALRRGPRGMEASPALSSRSEPRGEFTALVLAGSRSLPDPLARSAGVLRKALIPLDGEVMLARVLRTLREARRVGPIVVSGLERAVLEEQDGIADLLEAGQISLVDGRESPAASVLHALDRRAARFPVLVVTADHPLLTAEMVDGFCASAAASACDVAAGVVDAALVRSAFPGTTRTSFRFRDGACCGCNLYALLTPEARRAPQAWRDVERHRKRPWRLISKLGIGVLMRFALGRLTLETAVDLASRHMGLRARPVLLPWPEAAIDVDRPADLALARTVLRARSRRAEVASGL